MTDKLTAVLLFGVAAFLFSNFPDFHTIGSKLITLVEGALEIEFHQGGRWGVLLVPCSGAKQGPSDPNPPRNSMGERDGGDPPEDELARRLNFATPRSETKERHRHANQKSSSPGEAASVRDPLHGYKNGIYSKKGVKRRRRTFGIGVLAALMVWMLCIACLGVMVWLNCDGCSQLGVKDIRRFFDHAPLLEKSQYSRNLILRRTKPLLDIFGALVCSMFIGLIFAAFTCLLMYYDSDDPGHFPPTPVSPRRAGEESISYSGWHLGYIFAPVNFLVGFSLALIYLRLSVGLPLYPQV